MSGFCSAHQGYDPDCQICNASKIPRRGRYKGLVIDGSDDPEDVRKFIAKLRLLKAYGEEAERILKRLSFDIYPHDLKAPSFTKDSWHVQKPQLVFKKKPYENEDAVPEIPTFEFLLVRTNSTEKRKFSGKTQSVFDIYLCDCPQYTFKQDKLRQINNSKNVKHTIGKLHLFGKDHSWLVLNRYRETVRLCDAISEFAHVISRVMFVLEYENHDGFKEPNEEESFYVKDMRDRAIPSIKVKVETMLREIRKQAEIELVMEG